MTPVARMEAACAAETGEPPRIAAMSNPAPDSWTPLPPDTDFNVVIVGAGQAGLAAAHALRLAGIGGVLQIDASDKSAIGPWRTIARMETLRTPKEISGPELGNPLLGYRHWHEIRYGADSFATITRILRPDWADYLDWFRDTLQLQPRYDTRLLATEPLGSRLRLTLANRGRTEHIAARKLILATGLRGAGVAHVPPHLDGLPHEFAAHTDDEIDFARLHGKTVAVLGAASSAFDAAAVALEQGAARVDLFCRHDDIEHASPIRTLVYPGAVANFGALPDADRWRTIRHLRRRAAGPMPETVRRATAFGNFSLHVSSPWEKVRLHDGYVLITTPHATHQADFVIFGTGYRVDFSRRPETAGIVADLALWSDAHTPSEGLDDAALASMPYLDEGYRFTEKQPGKAPYLRNVHCFNVGALASTGRHLGEISSLENGIPRLVAQISQDLFLEDQAYHMDRIFGEASPHLTGEEYRDSLAATANPDIAVAS